MPRKKAEKPETVEEKKKETMDMQTEAVLSDSDKKSPENTSLYMTGSKQGVVVAMKAALPFTDGEMQELFTRTLSKVENMTEAEFAGLAVYLADEA